MPSDIAAGFIAPGETYETVGREVAAIAFTHPGWKLWWGAFAVALGLIGLLAVSLLFLLWQGTGVWGNNIPVTWALDIVSYDWWIGIASGGLIVSATLLMLGQEWRGALNRITETMALVAAAAAAVYPIIHLGRPWFFYWNLPYPNTFLLWPQFRSPLYWDAIDIISYLLVCLSFWYVGLLPDLATLRDRAVERARAQDGRGLRRAQLYGIAALGWRGAAAHWVRWTHAYRIIGLLGMVVVISLQSGAAVVFAGSLEPGWHDTLLPVSFLAGAILSAIGMIAALAVVIRAVFRLQALITPRHLDMLGWLMLGFGLLLLYCEASEFLQTRLAGDRYDLAVLGRRLTGPHAFAFWGMVGCALVPVHLLWVPRLRRSPVALAIVGILAAAGIWADHFMVIVVTLQHDFLPSASFPYSIDLWELATFAGSGGLFLLLLLLALRYLPVVSILETRRLAPLPPAHPATPDSPSPEDAPLWAVSAVFATGADVLAAARAIRPRDLGRLDSYSPTPIAGIAEALGLRPRPMRLFAVAGAVAGGAAMMGMCLYASGVDYVFDIGGRPRFSWPAFVVPSVSFAMLGGAACVTLALLALNRLPRLNHPAFNIPGFGAATGDRFFLVLEARDDGFDPLAAEAALAALPARPLAMHRVPR